MSTLIEKKLNRPNTEKSFKRLCEVLPGGVDSPARACVAVKQLPMIAARGKGDLIYDIDDHAYIDLCGSWGALIHGHAHSVIVDALHKRTSMGTSFGITTEIEGELARKICQHMPSIEKIRFVCSGTEATMSAARLARGYTGRNVIVKFNGNYHGHADFFLVKAGSGVMRLNESSSAGIPADVVKHTLAATYNDIEGCRALLNDPKWRDQIAAVIIEPIAGNIGVVPAKKQFLQMLRQETKKIGALLIIDEVITGFRVGLGGAQKLYGVEADITCLGKVMGGGMPAAAFGGKKEIMDYLAPDGPVYQAGTLAGNPLAMEAGLQAIKLLEQEGFYEALEEKTNLITEPVREAFEKKGIPGCVQQVGSMFTVFFGKEQVLDMEDAKELDLERFAQLFRYLFAEGIYIPPSQHEAWFVSQAHEWHHLEKVRDCIIRFINN